MHPVPLKLITGFKNNPIKDSFLAQVKKLEPETYKKWDELFQSK